MRKTFEVSSLLNQINRMLAASTSAEELPMRNALISVLENILHETGNYAGFYYLNIKPEHYQMLHDGATFQSLGVDVSQRNYHPTSKTA